MHFYSPWDSSGIIAREVSNVVQDKQMDSMPLGRICMALWVAHVSPSTGSRFTMPPHILTRS